MKTVLGLTGGSGSGKSVVADYLKAAGAAIIDADKIARQILEPGKPAYGQVIAAFQGITDDDGSLNRKELGALVFSDRGQLEKLNEITHPAIIREIEAALLSLKEEFVVIDAPLLFECGLDRLCSACACVLADSEIRKNRIVARDGIESEAAANRIQSQNDDDYFRARSHFVLENNGDLNALYRKVDIMLKELRP